VEAVIAKSFPLLAAALVPEYAPVLLIFGLIALLRGRK
jgi:hypothetical protein